MAYTPTEWKCGDVVSAEKLNKLEEGLAECCSGGGSELFVVSAIQLEKSGNDITITTDKTYGDFLNAVENNSPMFMAVTPPKKLYSNGLPDGIYNQAQLQEMEIIPYPTYPIVGFGYAIWVNDVGSHSFLDYFALNFGDEQEGTAVTIRYRDEAE